MVTHGIDEELKALGIAQSVRISGPAKRHNLAPIDHSGRADILREWVVNGTVRRYNLSASAAITPAASALILLKSDRTMTQATIGSIAMSGYRLAAGNRGEGGASAKPEAGADTSTPNLPYKVELWNEARSAAEQVLAITSSGSIGFAAYYAATREFPNRYITLRHRGEIVSRWNGPRD